MYNYSIGNISLTQTIMIQHDEKDGNKLFEEKNGSFIIEDDPFCVSILKENSEDILEQKNDFDLKSDKIEGNRNKNCENCQLLKKEIEELKKENERLKDILFGNK